MASTGSAASAEPIAPRKHKEKEDEALRHFEQSLLKGCRKGQAEVIHKLVDLKVSPLCTGSDGRTPLHEGAAGGSFDVCRLLLRLGADVNSRDLSLSAPLHLAAEAGSEKVVELLLDAQADVYLRDDLRRTPMDIAASHGDHAIGELIQEQAVRQKAQWMKEVRSSAAMSASIFIGVMLLAFILNRIFGDAVFGLLGGYRVEHEETL
mmetsp:Transcript_6300/g.13803  ORF Transcript_6300/g.13803 Transcript_6300/m.13803 type:complete len:207 (+) Transcript_6300:44-664(+)